MIKKSKATAVAIRNPLGILRLERLLCENEGAPNLLSAELRDALTQSTPEPTARRVRLCADLMLSLLDWLLARQWDQRFESNACLFNTVRNLFQRLVLVMKNCPSGNARIEASLVARYLVALADSGVDVTDRAQVMSATFQNDFFRLPKYWPAPSETWRNNVTEADWTRFLSAWEVFWSGDGRRSVIRQRKKRDRRKSLHEHFEEQGLLPPTRQQKRTAVFPLKETEMGNDAPPMEKTQQSAHAGLSAFAAQIVVDSRPLAVGLKILENVLQLHPEKLGARRCACLAVIETSLFCGIAVHDALNIALGPTKALVPAIFNSERECLTMHLAFGYHQAVLGRIPPQYVDIPLPLHSRLLFHRLVRYGVHTVADAFGTKPLDAFFEDSADMMSSGGIREFLRRLDIGWLYAAHRLAKLDPGVIELLRGNVWGPYRSETSYLTVSEEFLWASAYKIHDAIMAFLGVHSSEQREQGRATVRVGKQAASLDSLAIAANTILDVSEGPNELAACASWIPQFHGRRPTSDYPHCASYAVQCGKTPVFFLADKNMGSGRRLRLVPATGSAFEAAAAVRST